ncbi:hypothetical protein BH24ACT11_BH24ACT11_12640 [soil metagenome]
MPVTLLGSHWQTVAFRVRDSNSPMSHREEAHAHAATRALANARHITATDAVDASSTRRNLEVIRTHLPRADRSP